MPRVFSRREFHELVWSRPMTHLAKEFGISDVALHKICRKHDVPTPPAGYWAKKAHGKAVGVTPLPRASEPTSITVSEGATSEEGEAIAGTRAAVFHALAGWDPAHAPSPTVIIERTISRLETAKPKRTGLVTIEGNGLVNVAVRPESLERAARLLRLLADAAGHAGIGLEATRRPAAWRFDGEDVSFSLEEAADRVEHVATEKELAAVARWEAERQADYKRYGHLRDWGKPHIAKWEHQYGGRLAVRLEEVRIQSDHRWWGPVIRRSFADSKTRDLVTAIPRILSTVAAIAVAKRENRGVEERRRLAEQAARQRREEEQRREAIERARISALEDLLEEHQHQERLEAFLASLQRQASTANAPRVARLRRWAETRLERLRGDTVGPGLEARLERQRLFGDNED